MTLTREDSTTLDIIECIEKDQPRQQAFAKFWGRLYRDYKLDRRRYYSIRTTPASYVIEVDLTRTRHETTPKISKSNS